MYGLKIYERVGVGDSPEQSKFNFEFVRLNNYLPYANIDYFYQIYNLKKYNQLTDPIFGSFDKWDENKNVMLLQNEFRILHFQNDQIIMNKKDSDCQELGNRNFDFRKQLNSLPLLNVLFTNPSIYRSRLFLKGIATTINLDFHFHTSPQYFTLGASQSRSSP